MIKEQPGVSNTHIKIKSEITAVKRALILGRNIFLRFIFASIFTFVFLFIVVSVAIHMVSFLSRLILMLIISPHDRTILELIKNETPIFMSLCCVSTIHNCCYNETIYIVARNVMLDTDGNVYIRFAAICWLTVTCSIINLICYTVMCLKYQR